MPKVEYFYNPIEETEYICPICGCAYLSHSAASTCIKSHTEMTRARITEADFRFKEKHPNNVTVVFDDGTVGTYVLLALQQKEETDENQEVV